MSLPHLLETDCFSFFFSLILMKSASQARRSLYKLLLQYPQLGTNSYGHRAMSYTVRTVLNKLLDGNDNAPSVM